MKKKLFTLQILIFALMQLSPMHFSPALAADSARSNSALNIASLGQFAKNIGSPQAQTTEGAVVVPTGESMPKNWNPVVYVPDSARALHHFRDQVGRRVTVESYVGHFGAMFGQEFKQVLWTNLKEYQQTKGVGGKEMPNLSGILTLEATLADALILQKQLAEEGINLPINKVPDWFEKRLIEHADVAAQGRLKEILWEAKDTFKQLSNPKVALRNAAAIYKNQYEKPSGRDIKIAIVTTTLATGAIITQAVLGVGLGEIALTTLLALKIGLGGSVAAFNKFLGNIAKTSPFDDFKIRTGFGRLVSETLFALGSGAASSGGLQINQLGDTLGSTLAETATGIERENQIKSEKASARLTWMMVALGASIAYASAMGITGPVILETGFMQVTTLWLTGLAATAALFFGIKYKPKAIEKIAEANIPKGKQYFKLHELQKTFAIKPPVFSTPKTCAGFFAIAN